MQRLLIVSGFSALLFLVGLMAGRVVLAVAEPGEKSAMPFSARVPLSDETYNDATKQDAVRMPYMTVSSESITQDDSESSFETELVTDDSDDTAGGEAQQPPDSSREAAVLAIIRSVFPNADQETAAVWASVYADTDLSELAFILEQKRQLSGTLAAGSFAASSGDSPFTPPGIGNSVRSGTSVAAAINAVKDNLDGAWSTGFRRTVILPEVAPQSESMPSELRRETRTTMFRCFDPGRTISSPATTHVALSASDGSLMFGLAGNRLTRRGDFQVLPDRQIGLITQSETYIIEDSPTIPESATRVRITVSGEIHYIDGSGESVVAGRVSVRRVIDLAGLKTKDGVIFTMDSTDPESALEPAETELMTNRLEVSNVDCSEEHRLLECLMSLSQ